MERWWGVSPWTSHHSFHRRMLSASERTLRPLSQVAFRSQVTSLKKAIQESIQLFEKCQPFLDPRSMLAMHDLVGLMDNILHALRMLSQDWKYVALLHHDCSRHFKMIHAQLRDSVINFAISIEAQEDILEDLRENFGWLLRKLKNSAYRDKKALLNKAAEGGGEVMEAIRTRLFDRCYDIDSRSIQLKEFIGSGAFGTVYRAVWLGYHFAVKVLSSADESFSREVKALLRLRHPNVIRLVGFSRNPSEEKDMLVMEKMKMNLAAFIDKNMEQSVRGSPFRGWVAISIMQQVAEAMRYLHACSIIHRDLKPENILVDFQVRNGKLKYSSLKAKVSDFGVSRAYFVTGTMPGAAYEAGTLCYIAPEVYDSSDYSRKADVYSFGMVCYRILTGRVPSYNMMTLGPWEFMRRIQNGARPVLSKKDCPPYLARLITRCWSDNVDERPEFSVICQILLSLKTYLLSSRAIQLPPV